MAREVLGEIEAPSPRPAPSAAGPALAIAAARATARHVTSLEKHRLSLHPLSLDSYPLRARTHRSTGYPRESLEEVEVEGRFGGRPLCWIRLGCLWLGVTVRGILQSSGLKRVARRRAPRGNPASFAAPQDHPRFVARFSHVYGCACAFHPQATYIRAIALGYIASACLLDSPPPGAQKSVRAFVRTDIPRRPGAMQRRSLACPWNHDMPCLVEADPPRDCEVTRKLPDSCSPYPPESYPERSLRTTRLSKS